MTLQIQIKAQYNKLTIDHNSICEMLERTLEEHRSITESMVRTFMANMNERDFTFSRLFTADEGDGDERTVVEGSAASAAGGGASVPRSEPAGGAPVPRSERGRSHSGT